MEVVPADGRHSLHAVVPLKGLWRLRLILFSCNLGLYTNLFLSLHVFTSLFLNFKVDVFAALEQQMGQTVCVLKVPPDYAFEQLGLLQIISQILDVRYFQFYLVLKLSVLSAFDLHLRHSEIKTHPLESKRGPFFDPG